MLGEFPPNRALFLRRAEFEDALDLLAWRNDPLTRAMSRNGDVIDRDNHIAWYRKALKDPRKLFLVGLLDGLKVGLVRFDRGDRPVWEVSIMLAPQARGRKLSSPMLTAALKDLHANYQLETVTADVKRENDASLRLFSGLGFACVGEDAGLRHFILKQNIGHDALMPTTS